MNNTLFIALLASPVELEQGLWGLIVKGGWLMLPLLLLSVATVYIACERFWVIRKSSLDENAFAREIRELLLAGKTNEAARRCVERNTLLARVLHKGVSRVDVSPGETRRAMEERANIEIARLENGMSLLATCAGTAPMIGFLGTVIGMVQAFYDMAVAGNNIDIGLLARGIYTALITTVAGLIVGIIGNFAFNHLVAMTDRRVHWLESIIEEFEEISRTAREH
ncbi:MAG: MotA/TolQ/ExbB proton channel family protein [Odoribacteraceae bacterium]|jgi:biopolymer transport protein ExbB|nr:MotA/TolQ/ExbB proton channel family protein [Odoribacteraceae bacterium]